jgi:hypothetical protein
MLHPSLGVKQGCLFPIIAGPHGRPGQRLGENVESRCPAGPPITHVGAGGSGDLVRLGMGPHTHRLAPCMHSNWCSASAE